MKSLKLEDLRLLFNCYSPLKTNKQLINHYNQISQSSFDSNKNIRDQYNNKILKDFLNESVIKAAFVEKFSFKESKSSTVTVFELNTGTSRADICMLNGKSMVFEIKTEYDTFYRLEGQIADYKRAYQYLNLIIPLSKLDEAKKIIDETIGIITYSKVKGKITFNTDREPIPNQSYDSLFQLEQLTKKQLTSILCAPELSKDEMIQKIIESHTRDQINRYFIDLMKEKYQERWLYLYENRNIIKPLDYQWFFKNNISVEAVYS